MYDSDLTIVSHLHADKHRMWMETVKVKIYFFLFVRHITDSSDNKKQCWQKRMSCACNALRTDLTADDIYRMWALWILTCHVNTSGKSQMGNKSISVIFQRKARAQ